MLIVIHMCSQSIPTKLEERTKKISETRMTASVLKQDPNTQKVQKNAKFIKQQNDT